MTIERPAPTEYAPYYERYLSLMSPDADLLALLREQPASLRHILTGLTDPEATQPPAPVKWSIKQVLIHLIDCERVFAYRALAIARGEEQPLPNFEQDDYVAASEVQTRPLLDIVQEHAAQRAATLALAQSLSSTALARMGTAAGQPVSTRALLWIIAAHEYHHQQLLAQLLHVAA